MPCLARQIYGRSLDTEWHLAAGGGTATEVTERKLVDHSHGGSVERAATGVNPEEGNHKECHQQSHVQQLFDQVEICVHAVSF